MDKMNDATREEWLKDRDETVSSLDINKLKTFLSKWKACGVYGKNVNLPTDEVLEIAIRKMAMEITTIDVDVKKKAAAWLTEHGYSVGIDWGGAGSGANGET